MEIDKSMEIKSIEIKSIALNKQFKNQLDKTMEVYAEYKIEKDTTYPTKLGILNGITKNLKEIQAIIHKKNSKLERSIKYQSSEIEKYKEIERNLKNITSIEDLDATSKQMLSDSVSEYSQSTIVFWIYVILILMVASDILKYKRYQRGMVLLGLSLVLFIVYIVHKYFRG